MSHTTQSASSDSRPWTRRVAVLAGATAIAVTGGLVVAAPGQAAETVEDGAVSWGLMSTFRSYVGNQTAALPPIGALPVGERITVTAPATFDAAGTPAVAGRTETLPYLLPVTGGTLTDATHLQVDTAGGWQYHFPSHYFEIDISNVSVIVDGSKGTVVADVSTVVTGEFGDWEAGTYGGENVELAAIGNAQVARNGDTVTVQGSSVTLTAAGAEALPLYQEGEPLDSIQVSANLGQEPATPQEPTWSPQLSVSKQTGFNPDGSETVTVTGTGFNPNANISTRVPVKAGEPTGVYVVFGKFADTWQPSAGAPGGNRKVIEQKWALPKASKDQVAADYPAQAAALVELSPTGSFTATLAVRADESVEGKYGVYTYAVGGAASNASQELSIPIRFAGGPGEVDVDVTVPEQPVVPEPGEFIWRIDGGATAVSLGTAAVVGDHFAAQGELAPILVTDTRAGGLPWSVSAQVSDFVGAAGSFDGKFLGWTPTAAAGGGATAGAAVGSGFDSGNGLKDSRTLGSAASGHAPGSTNLGAGLGLKLPLSTPAGDYTGTLTLTAVS